MIINMTRNWSAVSGVNIHDGTADPVVYKKASSKGKDVNITKSIQNWDLYLENKEICDADYETFEKDVYKEIGQGE